MTIVQDIIYKFEENVTYNIWPQYAYLFRMIF